MGGAYPPTALAQGNLELSSVLGKYHTHAHMHTLRRFFKKRKKKTKKKLRVDGARGMTLATMHTWRPTHLHAHTHTQKK